MICSLGRPACVVAVVCVVPAAVFAQTADTLATPTLPPVTVTVTRAERSLTTLPIADQSLDRAQWVGKAKHAACISRRSSASTTHSIICT
jgi:hypothetical protein